MTTPAPFINWHALGQVLLTSVVTGVGIVVLFSVCVYSLAVFRRTGSSVSVRTLNGLIMTVTLIAIAAMVVWGLYVIIHK